MDGLERVQARCLHAHARAGQINPPNVKGPLDTGWGSTDFDTQLRDAKIGLPALPGQVTN